MDRLDVSMTPPAGMEKWFEKLFADHCDLSDFIMDKAGATSALGGRNMVALQKEVSEENFSSPNSFNSIWLSRFLHAIQEEVSELDEEITWKWWRPDKKTDLRRVREELVDIFHFLVSAIVVSGMTSSDFLRVFYQKRYINYMRQIVGRDKANEELKGLMDGE